MLVSQTMEQPGEVHHLYREFFEQLFVFGAVFISINNLQRWGKMVVKPLHY